VMSKGVLFKMLLLHRLLSGTFPPNVMVFYGGL